MFKKYIFKFFVFTTNFSIAILGILFLKNQSDQKAGEKNELKKEVVPISAEILAVQEQISADREQKLRDLNTSPNEIKKIDTAKTTTTTTTEKKPTSSSSSSSSSSSKPTSSTTKTS